MKKLITAVALAGLIVLPGCGGNADEDRVVAEVENQVVTESEFVQALKNKYGEEILDTLVQDKFFNVQAEKLGITEDDVKNESAKIREDFELTDEETFQNFLTAQKFADEAEFLKLVKQHLVVQTIAANEVTIAEEEIQSEYDAGVEIEASHILVQDIETAEELIGRINAGEDFATLAKEFSMDPGSGANGGNLGFFQRGRMVPEFEEAAFSLKTNELSAPVQSDFGYHIIKVTDRKPFEKSYEEMKEELEQIISKRRSRPLDQVKEEILSNATINIKDEQFNHLFKKAE